MCSCSKCELQKNVACLIRNRFSCPKSMIWSINSNAIDIAAVLNIFCALVSLLYSCGYQSDANHFISGLNTPSCTSCIDTSQQFRIGFSLNVDSIWNKVDWIMFSLHLLWLRFTIETLFDKYSWNSMYACAYDPNGMEGSCQGDRETALDIFEDTVAMRIVAIVSINGLESCGTRSPSQITRKSLPTQTESNQCLAKWKSLSLFKKQFTLIFIRIILIFGWSENQIN